MTPAQQTELDAYQAGLAARFTARRCRCGAPAVVVIIGCIAVREAGITLKRAVPDRNLCTAHAGLMSNAEGGVTISPFHRGTDGEARTKEPDMASAALTSIDTPKRFIDPNAPLATQVKVLSELIK